MGYRRGFKTEANWYAREMRAELRLPPHSPLCPWRLAKHLGYRVIALSEYGSAQPSAVAYLQGQRGQREFSAITLCSDDDRWIIHNDAHGRERQAANIAHELAHGLLLHEPAPLRGADGARSFNKDQEDEAHWLGPALLVSEEAALHIVHTQMAHPAACATYGVSSELLNMRLGVTGALKRGNWRAA